MGALTTHVLDTTRGKPGSGIEVVLYRINNEQREHLHSVSTNDDGRCDAPLLQGEAMVPGVYELVFAVGKYFSSMDQSANAEGEIRFLDDVVLRFGIAHAEQHYHVPLLVTPFSYSTYRGS